MNQEDINVLNNIVDMTAQYLDVIQKEIKNIEHVLENTDSWDRLNKIQLLVVDFKQYTQNTRKRSQALIAKVKEVNLNNSQIQEIEEKIAHLESLMIQINQLETDIENKKKSMQCSDSLSRQCVFL